MVYKILVQIILLIHKTPEIIPTNPKGSHKSELIGKKRIDKKNNNAEYL